MKVNLLKVAKNELKIEIQEEGDTLLNLLQKILLKNDKVEIAGYTVPHRLVDASVFYLRTKGDELPAEALTKASKELKDEAEEFKKQFKKALKEYEKGK